METVEGLSRQASGGKEGCGRQQAKEGIMASLVGRQMHTGKVCGRQGDSRQKDRDKELELAGMCVGDKRQKNGDKGSLADRQMQAGKV